MTPFTAPVNEILFSLEHVANANRLPDWDSDLVREIITHFGEFANNEIAPLDEPGDIEGCRLENGRVRMPKGFREVFQTHAAQGWPSLTAQEAHGGQGMLAPVHGAVAEIFSGACHSMQMVLGLVPCAVQTLVDFGSQDMQDKYLDKLISGECLATMALTESGAGSDLSRIRTKGHPVDGAWRLSGEKIFISGGDQDMSDGILHLVLAKTESAAGVGTKGLSLFLCPSHLDDGTRNSVSVARIEEKMGLHASPTCQMVFDEAYGELIGNEGEGLKAMFTMMNHARMDVSLQGVAHAWRASQIARTYAAERVQGRDPEGNAVTIDKHPDVARMLREQEALAVGGRAMCHVALVALDADDEPDLIDFLTPICKVFCTDAGVKSADLGIQVLGGYGYCREYRVEQTLRDARICSIYEGANGIHAYNLSTRLLRVKGGACADAFVKYIKTTMDETGSESHLNESLAVWQAARQTLLVSDRPGDMAHDFMAMTGVLLYQAVWRRIEANRHNSGDPEHLAMLAEHVRRTTTAQVKALATLLEPLA
ncbi:acyl-CoA dehydrogenase family protein [Actibacterium sp.]|uniref:acyl-CoA dehydrogenase family protein n=1 Tax=Actibacterium sp. TaxID=1872125 RepID=UPI00356B28D1